MCTVTFVRREKGYVLTSNRDEDCRRNAFPPRKHEHLGRTLLFPKDPQAEGSWIASRADGTSICLLNGAFEKHERRPPYRISRGKLLLNALANDQPGDVLSTENLQGLEPFTAILIVPGMDASLYRWDGNAIFEEMVAQELLLSSATLYDQQERQKRKTAFHAFLQKNYQPHADALLGFHQSTYTDVKENDFLMKRGPYLRTLSTTQVIFSAGEKLRMRHLNHLNNELTEVTL